MENNYFFYHDCLYSLCVANINILAPLSMTHKRNINIFYYANNLITNDILINRFRRFKLLRCLSLGKNRISNISYLLDLNWLHISHDNKLNQIVTNTNLTYLSSENVLDINFDNFHRLKVLNIIGGKYVLSSLNNLIELTCLKAKITESLYMLTKLTNFETDDYYSDFTKLVNLRQVSLSNNGVVNSCRNSLQITKLELFNNVGSARKCFICQLTNLKKLKINQTLLYGFEFYTSITSLNLFLRGLNIKFYLDHLYKFTKLRNLSLNFPIISFVQHYVDNYYNTPNITMLNRWKNLRSAYRTMNLSELRKLKLNSCGDNINIINSPNLTSLVMYSSNAIECCVDITKYVHLIRLQLDNAKKINTLDMLINLKELNITHAENLRNITKLTKLERLEFKNCGINSIKSLINLTMLRTFSLHRLGNFAHLHRLKEIYHTFEKPKLIQMPRNAKFYL